MEFIFGFSRLILGVAVCAVIVLFFNYKLKLRRLNHIPSLPGVFPLGHLIYTKFYSRKDGIPMLAYILELITGMEKLNGKDGIFLLRIGLETSVVVSSAEKAKIILSNRKELCKSSSYYLAKRVVGEGLITNDGDDYWKHNRKIINPTFHTRMLERFQVIMYNQSSVLEGRLSRIEDGMEIHIIRYMTLCTFDIIMESATGTPVNAQKLPDLEILESMEIAEKIWARSFVHRWMTIDSLFDLTSTGKEFQKHKANLQNYVTEVLTARKNYLQGNLNEINNIEGTDIERSRPCLLDLLLKEQLLHKDNSLTDLQIVHEIITMVLAGFQTTTVGLSWFIFVIGNYPLIQRKIQEELDSILGQSSNREITNLDLKEMKYLECVMKEVSRLYPPIPIVARILQDDLEIGKLNVPKGTEILVGISLIHKNPKYYQNPEEFIPERFLPENSKDRHPYAFIPFSSGPRSCIGKTFAEKSMMTIIATLLHRFEFRSVEALSSVCVNWEILGKPNNDVKVKVFKRMHSDA